MSHPPSVQSVEERRTNSGKSSGHTFRTAATTSRHSTLPPGGGLAAVNGVRSHPEFGENSALYKAMDYVPKNERKSGLVRPSDAVRPAIKVAA